MDPMTAYETDGKVDRYLTFDETAALMRQTPATLRWMRHCGTAPMAAKIGRRLVFRESDVRAWIESRFKSAGGPDAAA